MCNNRDVPQRPLVTAPRRALLSVSDKAGLLPFAKRLIEQGYELISTGGTKRILEEGKVPVLSVEDVTKFPECFGGRVKTMHPLLMGGILFRRSDANHVSEAEKLGIQSIDLVVVNLYPFAKTADDQTKTREEIIEQIDIGGPTLLRSAAKNHESVTVICDPCDYDVVMHSIETLGETSPELRRTLAAKVFLHTAAYDARIAEYLSDGHVSSVILHQGTTLRYGENPHQWGKYYEVYDAAKSVENNSRAEEGRRPQTADERQENVSVVSSTEATWGEKLQGKELSYLNILDADAAWNAVMEFSDPTAVFVKHANPSGIATHKKIEEAFQRAYDADRLSAFGVVIALNRTCSVDIATRIIDQKIFTEVLVAPDYEKGALEILAQKPNIRVIKQKSGDAMREQILHRSVLGGMLVQNRDNRLLTPEDVKSVTTKNPTPAEMEDLLFAWKCVKYAKSNAIVLAKDTVTVGIGAGQTSRVDSTWIALKRAGEKAKGSVLASDAFFPFPDSLEEAAKNGITAIIQPGGSIRDAEVFARAEELGIAMMLTGFRVFRH